MEKEYFYGRVSTVNVGNLGASQADQVRDNQPPAPGGDDSGPRHDYLGCQ